MFAGLRLSSLGRFTAEFPDADALHHALARWNRRRLAVQAPGDDWQAQLNEDHKMLRLEGAFVEAFREHVAPWPQTSRATPAASSPGSRR